MIEAQANGRSAANDEPVKTAFSNSPRPASIISYEADEAKTARMMLAISKLTRVTDGSPDLLEQSQIQEALVRLPRLQSYTIFRDTGVYSETRSAAGIFKRLGDWLE